MPPKRSSSKAKLTDSNKSDAKKAKTADIDDGLKAILAEFDREGMYRCSLRRLAFQRILTMYLFFTQLILVVRIS